MKKTIVALAVAAVAATSANAATVYNQDGTKVNVNGSVRLLLKKEKDMRGDLIDNGSRVSFKASHDLGEGLSVLGYAELRFSKDVKDKKGKVKKGKVNQPIGNEVHAKRLYAGFAYEGLGTLTFGNQLTIGDDVGVSDYTYFNSGINGVLITSGQKAINFKSAEFNGFTFGGAYVFSGDANKDALRDGRGFVVAGLYNRQIGDVGFAFEAGYSQKYVKQKVEQPLSPGQVERFKDKKEKAFLVGAELSYAGLALGVDYAQSKVTNVGGKKRALEVGLNYDLNDKAKVYTDFIWKKESPKGNVKRTRTVAVGFGYKLHKQVETFVEGAWGRKKDADGKTTKDNVVGTGLRVHF